MKRHYEEPTECTPREGVIASQSNTAKPEKVDDDYYYCHTAHIRGAEHSLLKFAKIPYGATRIPFIYDVTGDSKVQGFPRLSHRRALPLFPDIISSSYELPRVPEDIWHFSVASLFFQDEAWDAMMENSNRVCVDFTQFVKNYNTAVASVDRDALAPIYAHLDRIMTTLFNMHLRTASTLDLRYLIPFIAKIYTEGIEVALTPNQIPLWPTLTKRIFHKYVPEPGDEFVFFDEEEEENEVRDYDEDGSFDGGEALFGGSGLCETLILKGTPKKLLEVKSVKPEGIHAHGLTVASKKPVEVALPLPDMSNISPEVWIAYAIRKILGNAFNSDMHYYCTPEMLEEGFVKYDEKAEKGRFPVKIDREKVVSVLSSMRAKDEVVLTRAGVMVDSIDKMEEDTRVFTTLAWRQEREIVEKMNIITTKPITSSKFFEPDPDSDTGITFSDEQIRAVNSAITQPLTIITGPGGSGKTRIMHEIYRRIRSKYGPSARVMFVSFRNGIVNRLVSDINALDGKVVNAGGGSGLEGDDMETQKPLIFKTCDSIIYGLTKKKKSFDPEAVFMEEAGQSCGAHFQGLG